MGVIFHHIAGFGLHSGGGDYLRIAGNSQSLLEFSLPPYVNNKTLGYPRF